MAKIGTAVTCVKSAGSTSVAEIPCEDDNERVVDFHALRHTFVTNLANAGVHPKTAQVLARQSDVNLTLSRYAHSLLESQVDAEEAKRPEDAEGGTLRP